MGILQGIAELLAPTRCAGCELPGELLCASCREGLPRVDPACACASCGAPFGGLVCTECWNTQYAFEAAVAFGELSGALARAVVLHKDAGERRLGTVLGALVGECVAASWGTWTDAVCWIPPTAAAIARRGFDHGASLAVPAAECITAPASSLLVRRRAKDQRTMGRLQRLASAEGTFSARGPIPPHVLIVDDVLTTGATLDAAAHTLLAAGAVAVRVAVVARAW